MIAKTEKEAWDKQEIFKDQPHGWIQWKGTEVCVDIHCRCGKQSHYDGDFMYGVQCPHCKRTYHANGHIQLIEVEKWNSPALQKAFK